MQRDDTAVKALRASWGASIRERRKQRELPPMALASAIGVHISALYRIEAGEQQVGDELRIAIARELDTRVEELFVYPDRSATSPAVAS